MSVDEFVRLCTELKALGCAKVALTREGESWEAVFPVNMATLAAVPAARTSQAKEPEKDFRTPEQIREEMYARELGKR